MNFTSESLWFRILCLETYPPHNSEVTQLEQDLRARGNANMSGFYRNFSKGFDLPQNTKVDFEGSLPGSEEHEDYS